MMRSKLTFYFSFLLISPTALAAFETLPDAVEFYRQRNSPFASGQIERKALENKRLQSFTELKFRASWNGRELEIKDEDLLRQQQVSSFVQTHQKTALYLSANAQSAQLKKIPLLTKVEVLDFKKNWLKVNYESQMGWIPLHFTRPLDLSEKKALLKNKKRALNKSEIFLRATPADHAPILTTLPAFSVVSIASDKTEWVKAEYNGLKGYLKRAPLITEDDFNSSLKEAYLIKDLPLSNKQTVPKGTKVFLTGQKKEIWTQSEIKNHGLVWWKSFEQIPLDESAKKLTFDDIKKLNIFSYAIEKNLSLISAQGVWLSTDQKNWIKLSEFGDLNIPVAIREGLLYVGAQRSEDQGLSFEPYLKWDEITPLVTTTLRRSPRYLKIQNIQTVPQLKITLDTGVKRLLLKQNSQNESWSILTAVSNTRD